MARSLNDPPRIDLPKLPAPVKVSERPKETVTDPQPRAPEPTSPTLVDELREAAERGTAGTLILDWELHAGQVPSIISQFTATGFFQREGCGPAAVSMVVGRSGRRIVIEVTQPRRRNDPVAFEPSLGTEADISNPAVLVRIRTEIDQLRQVVNPLPMLVLLDPTVVPADFDRELRKRVEDIVEPGIYVVVINDTPGFQPTWKAWSPVALVPMLGAEPVRQDVRT